jgi:hypothetical protein
MQNSRCGQAPEKGEERAFLTSMSRAMQVGAWGLTLMERKEINQWPSADNQSQAMLSLGV